MQYFIKQLHPSQWNVFWDVLIAFGLRLTATAVILWIGWYLSHRISRALQNLFQRQRHLDATLSSMFCDSSMWCIRIITVVGALSQLGIQTTSIITVLGAGGLAIGLALQGTLQNIAAGIMLLLLRPFKVGDFINNGGGAIAGTVEAVSLFTTQLTKSDGVCEYVPNSQLWNNPIRNYSRNSTRRLDIETKISARDDVNRAINALTALVEADARILKNPSPRVIITHFDENIVVLNIRVWSSSNDFRDIHWKLISLVRKTLNDISNSKTASHNV